MAVNADTLSDSTAASKQISHAGPPPAADAAVDPSSAAAAEVAAARFAAAAARAGVDLAYEDVALALYRASGETDPKAFCAELKRNKPALFGPQPANTAPTPTHASPAAPPPGSAPTAYQTWQSLEDSGRRAEAEAYYRLNRRAVNRSAQ